MVITKHTYPLSFRITRIIAVSVTLLMAGCSASKVVDPPVIAKPLPPEQPVSTETLRTAIDKINGARDFVSLLAAIDKLDLLQPDSPETTLIIPHSASLRKLTRDVLAWMADPKNRSHTQRMVTHHTVPTRLFPASWSEQESIVDTSARAQIRLRGGKKRYINGHEILASYTFSDGVVILLDGVLFP